MEQKVFFRGEVRTFYSAEVVAIKTVYRPKPGTTVRCFRVGEAAFIRPHVNTVGLTKELRFWLDRKESGSGNRVAISWDEKKDAPVINGRSKFPVKEGDTVFFLPPEEPGQRSVYPVFSNEALIELEYTERPAPDPLLLPAIPPLPNGHRWNG